MDDLNALRQEIAKLQRRAARWKHAAKEHREKFLSLSEEMNDIIDDILNDLHPEEVREIYFPETVH
jgi:hypothetical protein